jgi:hypothetical protein
LVDTIIKKMKELEIIDDLKYVVADKRAEKRRPLLSLAHFGCPVRWKTIRYSFWTA